MIDPETLNAVDDRIRDAVRILNEHGIETFESCQGGSGHVFPQATVRFYGDAQQGYVAFAVMARSGFRVDALRRYWRVIENELEGPAWEIVLHGVENDLLDPETCTYR